MNQVAFSTVILRLIGFYVIYDLIAGLAFGAILQQAIILNYGADGQDLFFIGLLGLAVLSRAALGCALVLFAEKISRFLFREGEKVITDGMINGAALFSVGLSLLGFYFLLSYLPALVDLGWDWFRAEAADAPLPDYAYGSYYSPIELLVMTILSLFLIFRSKTICNWVIRVSR